MHDESCLQAVSTTRLVWRYQEENSRFLWDLHPFINAVDQTLSTASVPEAPPSLGADCSIAGKHAEWRSFPVVQLGDAFSDW